MSLLLLLIILPLVTAFILLLVSDLRIRSVIVITAAVILALGSMLLLVVNINQPIQFFKAESEAVNIAIMIMELVIGGYLFYIGFRYKRYWVPVLVGLQVVPLLGAEWFLGHGINVENNLFVDRLSIILALVIGVVGSLICVYALGYMDSFHRHFRTDVKDKQNFFFFLLFVFLSAMFGIVFANNLLWLYFFWEITTLCSFFLIGYKRNEESRNNAFRALQYNLIGGLAFAAALVYLLVTAKTIELDKVMMLKNGFVMLPLVLMAFAGLTKSAQLPFSSWLLGAMVAPTPVSALLHSSTMVKAGVYLVLRFSPPLKTRLLAF